MSEAPTWYRGLQVTFGLIAIVLAVAVWLYYTVAIFIMILLFAVSLLVIGFSGIIDGYGNTTLPLWRRALWLVLGLLSVVIAFAVIVFPATGISILILLLGIGLLINGLMGIISGALDSETPGGFRALLVIFGLIVFILSFYVIANPTLGTILWYWPPYVLILPGTSIPSFGFYQILPSFGYLLLVLFLSLGFIVRGIQAIIAGVKGTA